MVVVVLFLLMVVVVVSVVNVFVVVVVNVVVDVEFDTAAVIVVFSIVVDFNVNFIDHLSVRSCSSRCCPAHITEKHATTCSCGQNCFVGRVNLLCRKVF